MKYVCMSRQPLENLFYVPLDHKKTLPYRENIAVPIINASLEPALKEYVEDRMVAQIVLGMVIVM